MKCPKCSYERTPSDTAPAYECPRCGIVYAKYKDREDRTGSGPEGQVLAKAKSPSNGQSTPSKTSTFRRSQILGVVVTVTIIAAATFGAYQYMIRAEEARKLQEQAAQRIREQAKIDEETRQVAALIGKWSDAVELAGMTSRIALAQPISQMQAVRRELEGLELGECTSNAAKSVIEGMNDALFAFEMFIRYPNNASASQSTNQYLGKSATKVKAGMEQIKLCKAGE
jgi:hypothetical protein